MLQIIALLCLLISLNASGEVNLEDSAFIHKVLMEIQVQGATSVTEQIRTDLPSFLTEKPPPQENIAGAEAPEAINPEAAHPETSDMAGNDAQKPTDLQPDSAQQPTDLQPVDLQSTNLQPNSDLQQIDPKSIDYVEELKVRGFYKEESNDSRLNLRNAVLRFQSSSNLTADGIWGKKSMTTLALQIATGNTSSADQIDIPPSTGKWLTINKTKRILTLYEDKRVLQKFPVAIGNPPSLTPEGKFSIVSKVINPSWGGGGYAKPVKGGIPENPLGYRWLGLSYKDGSTLGIHGNNSPYSIGKNVSHGCIRMINSDVEQLFKIIPRSSEVWIGTADQLKEWGIIQNEIGYDLVLP